MFTAHSLSRTRGVAAVLTLLAVSVAIFAGSQRTAHAAGTALPAATYTWSMEQRFGPDRNLDGLFLDPHNTNASAHPATHQVTFNACTLGNAITLTYRWTIDGVVTENLNPICRLTRSLTRGNHTVTLRLTDGRSQTQTVRVRDIVIVSMGDSAGAGEGSPDVPRRLSIPSAGRTHGATVPRRLPRRSRHGRSRTQIRTAA